MKTAITKLKTIAIALLTIAGISACSSDFTDDPTTPSGQPVTVTLNIGVQEPDEETRAWDDINATDGEMMKNWFVVVTDLNNKIEAIVESGTLSEEKEHDDVTLTITTGDKCFYSFANIDKSSVLGNNGVGNTVDFSSLTFSVDGNASTVPTTGIPMSNRQKINVDGSTNIELYVVRMWAKVTLQFTNETAADIKIKSATLSEITKNASANSNKANLKLLPLALDNADDAACEPNLTTDAKTEDYTITPSSVITVNPKTSTAENKQTLTFYVNESATPTKNAHGLFTLTLAIDNGNSTEYMRYALITNDDSNWSYIARNDYRVIPVTLQEYKLDIVAYDWPPIGVYPASVKEEDGLFTATFHAPGHFHLQPVVTKYGDTTELPYDTKGEGTADTWTIGTVSGWETIGTVPANFYESDNTSKVDACENGGTPIWDETNHFIFGYLKDTGVTNATNPATKAFHDLTIQVNTGESATRQLTYHLCIVKDIAY